MTPSENYKKSLIQQLHIYLNRNDLLEEKKSIISSVTEGRTESSREMTIEELQPLVRNLRDMDPEERSRVVMAKKVIHLLTNKGGKFKKDDKPNMHEINAFILEKWGKKSVWSLSSKELPKIIGVLENRF